MDPEDLRIEAERRKGEILPFPGSQPVKELDPPAKVEPAKPDDIVDEPPQPEKPTWRDKLRALWMRFRISRETVNVNEKCPACGHRCGRIEYLIKEQKIAHQCMVCRAYWTEPPILHPSEWHR